MLMERLTAGDQLMLWPDEIWPQDIGALAVLDGSSLLDTDGRFRIEAIREAVAGRLHLVPRFRQLLYTPPRRLGGPLWVDAANFDLDNHIGSFDFRGPGTRPSSCSQLSSCGIDVWIGHARCGRCGFSLGYRTDA